MPLLALSVPFSNSFSFGLGYSVRFFSYYVNSFLEKYYFFRTTSMYLCYN
nr:MAG TPA: hypothetical protein [Caudoviricetes sp.]